MDIPDQVLDWPLCYWQDEYYSVAFICDHRTRKSAPDKRCKTGIRTWTEPCHYYYPPWHTVRDLIAVVTAHVRDHDQDPA